MPSLKFLLYLSLGLTVVFAQVGVVRAAPPEQAGASITGTIQNVVVEAGSESGVPTVFVTLLVNSDTQIVCLDFKAAVDLGLILLGEEGHPILDETGIPVVDTSVFWTDIEIDSDTIIPDETPATEERQHPVDDKVAEFFSSFIPEDYELVMSSHSNGFGFGVITQASWMTEKMGGDSTLFQTILEAKQSNDYASIALPDGAIPQNWGQLKKAVLHGDDHNSLGDVVSNDSDNGKDHQTSQKDKDDDHGWKNDKPVTPPGQTKEKDNNGNSEQPVVMPPGQNKDKENNGNSGNPPGQNKDKDNNGKGKTK